MESVGTARAQRGHKGERKAKQSTAEQWSPGVPISPSLCYFTVVGTGSVGGVAPA